MMKSYRKVLIVNTEPELPPTIYDPVSHWSQHLSSLNVEHTSIGISENMSVAVLEDEISHIILTGSSASVNSAITLQPWVVSLMRFVERAIKLKIPVLGSCFGHQFLARMFGDKTSVVEAACPEVGWSSVKVLADSVFGAAAETFTCFNFHFDEVAFLPDEFELCARSRACGIHAFRHKDYPVFGVQSHAEIIPGVARHILEGMVSRVSADKRLYIEKALEEIPDDSNHVSRILNNFLNY